MEGLKDTVFFGRQDGQRVAAFSRNVTSQWARGWKSCVRFTTSAVPTAGGRNGLAGWGGGQRQTSLRLNKCNFFFSLYIREVSLHIADGPKASDQVRFCPSGPWRWSSRKIFLFFFFFFGNVFFLPDSELELRAIHVVGSLCQALFLLNEQAGASVYPVRWVSFFFFFSPIFVVCSNRTLT